jgi:hypothetical protein
MEETTKTNEESVGQEQEAVSGREQVTVVVRSMAGELQFGPDAMSGTSIVGDVADRLLMGRKDSELVKLQFGERILDTAEILRDIDDTESLQLTCIFEDLHVDERFSDGGNYAHNSSLSIHPATQSIDELKASGKLKEWKEITRKDFGSHLFKVSWIRDGDKDRLEKCRKLFIGATSCWVNEWRSEGSRGSYGTQCYLRGHLVTSRTEWSFD